MGSRRFSYEMIVLAIFVSCTVGLKLLSPLEKRTQDGYKRPDNRRSYALIGAGEPSLGAIAPDNLVKRGQRTAVIVLSECGECSENAVTALAMVPDVDRI